MILLLGVFGAGAPSAAAGRTSEASSGAMTHPADAAGLGPAPWATKGSPGPAWSPRAIRPAVSTNSPWSLETTSNPTVPSGTLTADACGSSSCTAVGDYVDATGDLAPWAEGESGSGWTPETTPDPPGASAGELLGVACPAVDVCTAVGFSTSGAGLTTPLVETWNGATWTIRASPAPPAAGASGLLSVACPSPGDCQAVGEADGSGGLISFAEGWNGVTWSVETVPAPVGSTGSRLLGVACPTEEECTAVGGYGSPGGAGLTLAEVWDGASWSVQSTPDPGGSTGSGLLGVSCTSSTACTGVGSYDTGSGTVLILAESWDGTSWSIQPTPDPPGTSGATLNSVSCTVGTCTAAGYSASPTVSGTPLTEAWNGTSWTVRTIPSPPGATAGGLLAVSCESAPSCIAVGSYDRGTNSIPVPLVESWSAPTWSVETGASPASAGISDLKGVSCISAAVCVAVGFSENDVGATLTLAEVWNGTQWSVERPPDPVGTSNAELDAVSCSSPTACTAVGDFYQDATGDTFTLAETWNGRTWSIRGTPDPAGISNSALFGVSCTSSSACTAVGEAGAGTLVEVWNGSAWTIQATPTPSGSGSTIFFGVSCPSATSCTAVGLSTRDGDAQTLAERRDGAGWVIQPTPDQPGSANLFSGVSCPTATTCVAVGSYENSFGTLALAEAWNGTGWAVDSTPDPTTGADAPSLTAVSCASPSDCDAVGNYSTNSLPVAYAEAWNGAAWSLQSVPSPALSVSSFLGAVACTSGGCSSVGYRQGGSGVQVTLAVENPGATAIATDPVGSGYWSVDGAGLVTPHGSATLHGDTRSVVLARPVRAIAATSDGEGYWLVGADGGVFAYGDASYEESLPQVGVHVDDIVGLVPTRDGRGYWLVGADGGVFAFGDAGFHGSLPSLGVHVSTIVGIAAAPSSSGYLLVGSDGGVFAFGSAVYHGSLPGLGVRATDIVGLAPSPDGNGYLLAGRDGGVFAFGSGAPYLGSLPGEGVPAADVVGLALTPDGLGYRIAEAIGTVWDFGDADGT
jgi:hypothetical protein